MLPVTWAPEVASRIVNCTDPTAETRGDTQISVLPSSAARNVASPNTHIAEEPSNAVVPPPRMVTRVEPLVGPLLGTIEMICLACAYSNVTLPGAKSTPLLLTPTRTTPSPRSGTVQTILVDDANKALTTTSSPNRHFRSSECEKCCPTTVTACAAPTLPEIPRDGISSSTIAVAS